jgi:hypothetical protein
MKTFTSIIIAVLSTVLAGTVLAESPVYFFGSCKTAPNLNGEYTIGYMRVGVSSPLLDSSYSATAEYNLAKPCLIFAKIQKDINVGDGILSLTGGQYLNPPQNAWPGAKGQRNIWWPEMQSKFTSFGVGLMAQFKYYALTIQVADYKSNSATVNLAGFTYIWEKNAGSGLVYSGEWNRYLNPAGGAVKLADHQKMYFAENFVKIGQRLRLYGQVDFGDSDTRWISGFNYEYQKLCFVKGFYNFQTKAWTGELTFSI